MARPKQTMIDAAAQQERERCRALVVLVTSQPETYAARRGLPDVAAAIIELIDGGYTVEDAPTFEERDDGSEAA